MGVIQPKIELFLPFESTLPSLGTDVSGNNKVTDVYGVTQGTGQIGGAGDFVTNDYMVADYIDAKTILFWVNINSAGNYGFVTKLPALGALGSFSLRTTSGVFEIYTIDSGGGTVLGSTGVDISSGWYHCAYTYDDDNMVRLYLNAIQKHSFVIDLPTLENDIYIGSQELSIARRFLDGSLSKLKVFSTALSEENIRLEMIGKNAII